MKMRRIVKYHSNFYKKKIMSTIHAYKCISQSYGEYSTSEAYWCFAMCVIVNILDINICQGKQSSKTHLLAWKYRYIRHPCFPTRHFRSAFTTWTAIQWKTYQYTVIYIHMVLAGHLSVWIDIWRNLLRNQTYLRTHFASCLNLSFFFS